MSSYSPLLAVVSQYGIITALAKHLQYFDLHNLAALDSSFRREIKDVGKPGTAHADGSRHDAAAAAATTTGTAGLIVSSDRAAQRPTKLWKMLAQLTTKECQQYEDRGKWGNPCWNGACPWGRCPFEALMDDFEYVRRCLGIANRLNKCRNPGCERAVCFVCWWMTHCSNQMRRRGGGRSRNYCAKCFASDTIPAAHEGVPAESTRAKAADEGRFCQCGSAVFCSACYNETDMFGRPLDPEREQRWEDLKQVSFMRYTNLKHSLGAEALARQYMDPSSPASWEVRAPGTALHQKCWSCQQQLSEKEFASFLACRLCSLPVATNPCNDVDHQLWPGTGADDWRTMVDFHKANSKIGCKYQEDPAIVREGLEMSLRRSSGRAITWIKSCSNGTLYDRCFPPERRLRLLGEHMWELRVPSRTDRTGTN
ncbi:hypothetical protein K490DRAFT_60710 [Saccharata proteae CBS 121410]|uniref:Uncharacterized protein n=1 Tax=Saccharata proteae CBS 121410 TaxID=1314787 RepID=A0A9P4HLU6_9PEZI|nr:hypothetical protein K490DRAFT_60710 [Saccharata proteae CBS 121410]